MKPKEMIRFLVERRSVRRQLRPRAEFLMAAREHFLKTLEQEVPTVTKGRTPRIYEHVGLRYALLMIGVVFLGNIGTAIVADAANVPLDHPLYQYKRLDESVRTFLSPAQTKSVVHTQLAERRLNEMQSVLTDSSTSTKKGTSPGTKQTPLSESEEKIQRLTKDLQEEVDASLQKSKENKVDVSEVNENCDQIQDILEKHKKLALSEHTPELNFSVFQKYCKDSVPEKTSQGQGKK
jgi:hypothetical protein